MMNYAAVRYESKKGWHLGCALLLAILTLATTASASASQKLENFDSDPGWTGVGNTTGVNNFGFSNTNNAGGTAGELGGSFESVTDAIDYYADTHFGGLSQQSTLTSSFRFMVPSNAVDGYGIDFGWFDRNSTNEYSGGIEESIKVRVIDKTVSSTFRFQAFVGQEHTSNSGGGATGNTLVLDFDTEYLVDMSYDPAGAGVDDGRLTVEVQDASSTPVGTMTVDRASNDAPWSLNSFGVTTNLYDDGSSSTVEAYFDNVSYTVPEPSSILLLGLSLAGLGTFVRRRDK